MATKKAKPAPKPKKPTLQEQVNELSKSLESVSKMVSESMERSLDQYNELLKLVVRKTSEQNKMTDTCSAKTLYSYKEIKDEVFRLVNYTPSLSLSLKVKLLTEVTKSIVTDEEESRNLRVEDLREELKRMAVDTAKTEVIKEIFDL